MRFLSSLHSGSVMGVCGSYSIKNIVVRDCYYPVIDQEGRIIGNTSKIGIHPVIHIAKCCVGLIYRRDQTTMNFSFANPSPISWAPFAWADGKVDISKLPIKPCPHHHKPHQKGQKDFADYSDEPFCGKRELVKRFLFAPTENHVIDEEGCLGRVERRWLEWAYIVRQAVCIRNSFDISSYYSELPMTWETKWVELGFAMDHSHRLDDKNHNKVLTPFPCRYHITPTFVKKEGEEI